MDRSRWSRERTGRSPPPSTERTRRDGRNEDSGHDIEIAYDYPELERRGAGNAQCTRSIRGGTRTRPLAALRATPSYGERRPQFLRRAGGPQPSPSVVLLHVPIGLLEQLHILVQLILQQRPPQRLLHLPLGPFAALTTQISKRRLSQSTLAQGDPVRRLARSQLRRESGSRGAVSPGSWLWRALQFAVCARGRACSWPWSAVPKGSFCGAADSRARRGAAVRPAQVRPLCCLARGVTRPSRERASRQFPGISRAFPVYPHRSPRGLVAVRSPKAASWATPRAPTDRVALA